MNLMHISRNFKNKKQFTPRFLKKVKFWRIKNNNQLIIVAHSEVIFNEASDTPNLELIMMGQAIHLAEKSNIKKILRDFGIEHYYKARHKKTILLLYGETRY